MPCKTLSRWADFYRDRVNQSYFEHIQRKYEPFINAIADEVLPAMKVVELGCGIGSITKALIMKQRMVEYCVVDSDKEMLALTHNNLNMSGMQVKYLLSDIRQDCWWGDVAHSHGVLEHFSNEDIRAIIKKQREQYEVLLHYVPSYLYVEPSFGDERLMTPENWHDICKPDEIIEFNGGFDLILKWKSK